MTMQAYLFDLAAVAPSRGEHRHAKAAARREEEARQKSANRSRRWMKVRAKQQLAEAFPAVECCLYWYPPNSGWTRCHKCGKPLYPI